MPNSGCIVIVDNPTDLDSFAVYGPIAGMTEKLIEKGYNKALDATDNAPIVEIIGDTVDEVTHMFRPRQMAREFIPDIDLSNIHIDDGEEGDKDE